MRLSGLLLTAFLLISPVIWAQHSSTSSSGSSGSSSSGGGSHGGGGGGSTYSGGSSGRSHSSGGGSSGGGHSYGGGGGHSSGGASISHGSNVRGTALHGTNSIETSRPTGREPVSNLRYSPRGLNIAPQLRVAPPEKRTFFSFIRHPFHRPQPRLKPEIGIVHRPICFRGLCPVCPPGQARVGGCSGAVIPVQRNDSCSYQGLWNGRCAWQVQFADDCGGLRFALQRQLQRMQEAEAAMQGNCQAGANQECSETTAGWNSESSLYRALQSRYRSCLAQSAFGYGFGGATYGLQSDLLIEPPGLDLYP